MLTKGIQQITFGKRYGASGMFPVRRKQLIHGLVRILIVGILMVVPGSMCADDRLTADTLQLEQPVVDQTKMCLNDTANRVLPFVVSADTLPRGTIHPPIMSSDHKFSKSLTFIGVPLFFAGLLGKNEKNRVHHVHKDFVPTFRTTVDDYIQYSPFVLSTGLKLMKVPGKGNWVRYTASSAMSFGIMAILVNSIKYTARELRPDRSTRNSFPSGHTATAFVAATILHKEYGLTQSPWYSVAGYSVATGTGMMRMLNNRHWVSDVFAGAGIGIMSTELAYALTDMMFKKRGLVMEDRMGRTDLRQNPSFIAIQMGVGWGGQKLSMPSSFSRFLGNRSELLRFSTTSVVGLEGAYFLTPNIGLGGEMKLTSHRIKGLNKHFSPENRALLPADNTRFTIERNGISEFSAGGGVYFSLPLSARVALGSKLLVGKNSIRDISVNATKEGTVKKMEGGVVTDTHQPYKTEWNYLMVRGNAATKLGTGLSLTVAYKSSYCWKTFIDFCFSRNTFTAVLNPSEWKKTEFPDAIIRPEKPLQAKMKKNMSHLSIGTAFTVSF